MDEGLLTQGLKPIRSYAVKKKAKLGMDEMKEARLEYIRQRIRKSNLDTRPNLDADEAEAEMARFMSRER